MNCTRKINKDVYYIGGNDRRLALFENAFPIPKGVSYNSYIIDGDKTALMDTVDRAISEKFLENIKAVLAGKPLDYIIINHMEPDHCATLGEVLVHYPEATIVGSSKTMVMIEQFFDFEFKGITAKEGDTLDLGNHTLTFAMAPMVHWPEVMVTYDMTDKTLYSADAFGTFGALNGNIFADEMDFECEMLDEARRYYTNIVGKYGNQVLAVLKKLEALDVKTICPLHGPIWRENIPWFVEKHRIWASYEAEEKGVMIAYASIYGNTENAMEILAVKLGELGIRNIRMYDVSTEHVSNVLAECFKYSNLIFASPTYNNDLFPAMETLLLDLKAHNFQNRNVAIAQNGSWAPQSGKKMTEIFEAMKNVSIMEESVTIKSSVKEETLAEIEALANAIYNSIKN